MKDLVKPNMTVTPEFLAERGYSLTKAAQAAGVSPTHLRLVLKGERKPSEELMLHLRSLPKFHPVKCRVCYAQ